MAGEIYYKGEIGRRVQLQTGIDWTGHDSGKQIKVLKPDGTYVTKTDTQVIVDDAITGIVSFLTIESDHSVTGMYHIQAKLSTTTTKIWTKLDYYWVEDVA
jgi:DNA-binding beta-propeller fold protein YncE